MKGEVKKYQEDLKFYWKEKRQLKKELEAQKVSVAYIHMTTILSRLLICCMSQDHVNENCQSVQLFWDKFQNGRSSSSCSNNNNNKYRVGNSSMTHNIALLFAELFVLM